MNFWENIKWQEKISKVNPEFLEIIKNGKDIDIDWETFSLIIDGVNHPLTIDGVNHPLTIGDESGNQSEVVILPDQNILIKPKTK